MTENHTDLAFIGTKGSFLPSLTKARLCTRARRRHRSRRHWRCIVQDGPAEQSTDPPNLEGAVPFDKFDAGLEAALSKGWEKLDNFDASIPDAEEGQMASAEHVDENYLDSAESPNVLAGDSDASMVDGATQPVVLESSIENQGDTQTVEDAKPKTKRKRRVTKKAKETKKMTNLELKESEEWSTEPRWYFVQVKPGCEQSTAVSIRNLAASLESSDIREVLVPTTTIMRLTKGGKSVKKEERFFPSYILVLMVMNRRIYSEILAVPNVQFFMGDPNRDKKKNAPMRPPLPVKDAEMKNVFERIEAAESAKPEIKTAIRPGDSIKVISGSFEENTGRVLEVKPDLNVVKANLFIFGRETAVELGLSQVEVIDDIMNVREDETSEEQEEEADTGKKRRGRGKSIPGGGGPSAGVASPEDDLAALLEDMDDDSWEASSEDDDGDKSDTELVQADDDGFGEADIIEGGEDEGFESAEMEDEDSDATKTNELVTKKTNGFISSNDELADLLSDDYSESSEWTSNSEDSKSEDLDDLDEFFSSLDELDESGEESTDEGSDLDGAASTKEGRVLNEQEEKELSDDELMRRMESPLSEEDEDDLGFSGQAMLAEVDEMMAEVAAGKREIGPSEEYHDLSQPLITTEEAIPEIDLFAMPDLDAHKDPDTTANPAPKKR